LHLAVSPDKLLMTWSIAVARNRRWHQSSVLAYGVQNVGHLCSS